MFSVCSKIRQQLFAVFLIAIMFTSLLPIKAMAEEENTGNNQNTSITPVDGVSNNSPPKETTTKTEDKDESEEESKKTGTENEDSNEDEEKDEKENDSEEKSDTQNNSKDENKAPTEKPETKDKKSENNTSSSTTVIKGIATESNSSSTPSTVSISTSTLVVNPNLATSTISTSTSSAKSATSTETSNSTSTSTPEKNSRIVQVAPLALAPAAFAVFDPGWTIEKAEHLAKRTLIDPVPDDIITIFNQGSLDDAVEFLFTPPTAQEISEYQADLADFATRNNENLTSKTYMQKLYMYKIMHDPYEAKRKLWLLFEDTFSVDAPLGGSRNIDLTDAVLLHDLVYNNMLGSYQDLVEMIPTNYAMGKYLDLFNAKIDNPNQNFARELMQLFLMEEYHPLSPGTINYSDADVRSLSYILTGYSVNEGEKNVFFDPASHNDTLRDFLGEEKNDPSTIVDYIFEKRETEISNFIGAKLLRFYVNDDYSLSDLNQVASELRNNDFEIEPTVKWLLKSDIMFSQSADETIKFKNPMELIAGTYALLYQNLDIDPDPTSIWSSSIGFTPYSPRSIFGRTGFEENDKWFNSNSLNSWVSISSKIAFESNIKPQNWTVSDIIPWLSVPATAASKTPANLIDDFENALLFGHSLPANTKVMMETFLTVDENGQTITFNPTDTDYQSKYIRGLVALFLAQPEYLMLSGFDNSISTVNSSQGTSEFADAPDLVLVKLNGGFDYMGTVAPVNDPSYNSFRGTLALESNEQLPLKSGYALNSAAADFLPYYNAGELHLINSVGLPSHSRSHSRALEQMETGLLMIIGAIGKFFEDKDNGATNQVSLYNGLPHSFKGAPQISIGTQSLLFQNNNISDTTQRAHLFKTLKDIIKNREHYSGFGEKYIDATLLNDVAVKNIADGGNGSAGNNNERQFKFLESLMDNNFGKVFYMRGNGGYDTHGNQETGYNSRVATLANDATTFFENAKANGKKLTIVIYSEFGRTNKMNGNNGTDHGTGGGMIILSNVLDWPNMIGEMKPSLDSRNWLTPRVDARTVWASLLSEHYDATPGELFGTDEYIEDYYDTVFPTPIRLQSEDLDTTSAKLSFVVQDGNFDISNTGLSTVEILFGTNSNALTMSASINSENNGKKVIASFNSLDAGTEYFYKISLTDNIGNFVNDFTGSFTTGVIKNRNTDALLVANNNQINMKISGVNETTSGETNITPIAVTATSSSRLSSLKTPNLEAIFQSSTTIIKILSDGETKTWLGGFLAPVSYKISEFIKGGRSIVVGSKTYSYNELLKIIKIGADTPGISLEFNKEVSVSIPAPNNLTEDVVNILHSKDGETWDLLLENIPVVNGTISFNTIHFSYFLITGSQVVVDPGDGNNGGNTGNNGSGGGAGRALLPFTASFTPFNEYSATVSRVNDENASVVIDLDLVAGNNVESMSISPNRDFSEASIIPYQRYYQYTGDYIPDYLYLMYYNSTGVNSAVIKIDMPTTEVKDVSVKSIMYSENICESSSLPDNSLIRTSKIFVVKNGKKHYVSNLFELNKYKGKEIQHVSNQELSQIPNSTENRMNTSRFKEGDLLRSTRVYITKGTGKQYIHNLDELRKYERKPICNVSNQQAKEYETVLPDNTVVSTSKIYVILNGEKHYIKNLSELRNYQGKEIKNISIGELESIPSPGQNPLSSSTYNDGELLRASWIYKISGSRKIQIHNINELEKNKKIFPISHSELKKY